MRSHELVVVTTWVLAVLPAVAVAFVIAVLVPLALGVLAVPRWLVRAAWGAGALGALALVLAQPGSALAIGLLLPYVGVALAAGALGGVRLLAALRPPSASRITQAVALLFVPAATAWLFSYAAGHALLGYPPFWVILTAAHFHVAGICLLATVGCAATGRGPLAGAVALACVAAIPITAAGIYGPRWLETVGALAMAASAAGAGILFLVTPHRLARIAGAVLLVTMVLAGLFALRDHSAPLTLFGLDPLASMLIAHGIPNAFVIAFLALLAFSGASGGARTGGRRG